MKYTLLKKQGSFSLEIHNYTGDALTITSHIKTNTSTVNISMRKEKDIWINATPFSLNNNVGDEVNIYSILSETSGTENTPNKQIKIIGRDFIRFSSGILTQNSFSAVSIDGEDATQKMAFINNDGYHLITDPENDNTYVTQAPLNYSKGDQKDVKLFFTFSSGKSEYSRVKTLTVK